MEKEKFISKLNIKDYNNQLEKILSKKTFSETTKNLLLSMLYKIENAYDDYSLVNGDTKTKKETLEEILDIISKDCESIEIIKTKESRVDEEKKKIITYLNTRKMLYEIYQIDSNKFYVSDEYEIIKPALEDTLNQGYSIASNEVIRDFDGWSWNIVVQEIENLKANFVYQILRILVGSEFLNEWKKSTGQNYIARLIYKLEKLYKTELSDKIFKLINQISILNVVSYNSEENSRLIGIQEELQKSFDEIDNKKEYVNSLWEKKKVLVSDIKKLDSILKDDRKLKEEFITRNQLLDMNNRIFSLSDLAEVIEGERESLIKKLSEYNKKMEPLNFIKTKTDIENNLLLLKELEFQNKNKKVYASKVKELLKLVSSAMKIQIDMAEEKEELIKLVYKVRYFGLIYVSKDKQVKDIIDINVLQRLIITKACKQRVITIFSKNIKENYEIIKNILQTDVIELQNIYFRFIREKDNIVLEVYDEENICKIVTMESIEELNVKLNKKIKVFI